MFLCENLREEVTQDHAADVDHCRIYQAVMKERHGILINKKGRLYFDMLWDSIVPKGNIYRYIGIATERLKNSADMWSQLDELAEDCKAVAHIGKSEDRCKEICKALQNTKVVGSPEAEESRGFQPLEEFLSDTRAKWFGPIVIPIGRHPFNQWFAFRLMAFLVCAIQWIAPLAIFVYEWNEPANRLKNFNNFLHTLTWGEMRCLGLNTADRLHTLMGVILLELVLLIIHMYVRDQRENAHKAGRLPMVRFWFVLGNVTNMWCCIMTCFAVPVLFWSESSPTSTAMDSLTTLFIFMLDDFAGYACQYTGMTDDDFQRAASWQVALLSQCPVSLKDLVNSAANHPSEIWSIRFDEGGRLLQAPCETVEAPRQCERRLQRMIAEESSPLNHESRTLCYRHSIGDPGITLPGWEATVLELLWRVIDLFLGILQVVMPFAWMAVNKPCNLEGEA